MIKPVDVTFDEHVYKIRNFGLSHLFITTELSSFYIYDCTEGKYVHFPGVNTSPITSLRLIADQVLYTTLRGDIFIAPAQSPNAPTLSISCSLSRQPDDQRCYT